MQTLKQQFDRVLARSMPIKTVWLGLSGGLDSVVLLHLVSHSDLLKSQGVAVQAIHVNHGLSPNAADWAKHCVTLCQAAHIPYVIKTITSKPKTGDSLEAWARAARRDCFLQVMQTGDVLLTAQHQDDQAETVLVQLLRGAGVRGLAAMPEVCAFGPGQMLRPLLEMARADLAEYATQHGLSWVEDESNQNVKFDRNYLRHEILPRLNVRWPASSKVLARTADNAADISEVLRQYLQQVLPNIQIAQDQLSIPALLSESLPLQRLLLQTWLQQQGAGHVSRAQLQQILNEVVAAKTDAQPCYHLKPITLRRHAEKLYAVSELLVIPDNYCKSWNGSEPLMIPGWGRLDKAELAAQGLAIAGLDWSKVIVRFREGGERCRPKGRRHSQDLKKLLQEYQVAPWLRDRLPLLYCGNELVMVVGAFICENQAN